MSNRSTYTLTESQHQVLGFGLAFSLPPRTDACTEFLVSLNHLEKYASDIKDELRTLRGLGLAFLEHLEPHVSGLPKRFITALQELKRNPKIIILPADKGNTAVVLDKETYLATGEEMLSDTNVYEPLTTDPLKTEQASFNAEIKDIYDSMGFPRI